VRQPRTVFASVIDGVGVALSSEAGLGDEFGRALCLTVHFDKSAYLAEQQSVLKAGQ
jgi:hypothetical protein